MTRSKATITGLSMLVLGALLLCSVPMFAADSPAPTLGHAVAFASGRVPYTPPQMTFGFHEANPVRTIPKPNYGYSIDPVAQTSTTQQPTSNWTGGSLALGIGVGFPGYSVPDAPPDTTLAVGDTEVCEWVNVSYACFDKATGAIIPIAGQNFLPGNHPWQLLMGSPSCKVSNAGDPVIKFDRQADRWVMTQNVFTSPYAVCIAISQTNRLSNDTWFVYQFAVPGSGFPDYPKMGVWPTGGASDGYFEAVNNFGPGGSGFRGPQICGYHRSKLLVGDATAEQICFQLSNQEDSLLPADADSPNPPPTTEDEFFIGSVADVNNHSLSLYSMHIDNWATGSASMMGSPNTILLPVAPYSGACSGTFGGACVPSSGGAPMDTLADRLMYRFAYWRDTPPAHFVVNPPPLPHQHWAVNFSVESPTGQIGVKWYDLQASLDSIPVTSLAVPPLQEGTYAPDSTYRWMGSIARDKTGDLLVGYSQSSAGTHPAIYTAGRIPSDTPGMLEAELVSVIGAGSQTDTSNRWGDYSTMEIDPVDNCTLFYSQEYYMSTGSFHWSTDISKWKFSRCH